MHGLETVQEPGCCEAPIGAGREDRIERLVALGRALSDPIRVRMLGMMAEVARSGRGCCELPDLGEPAYPPPTGICVCEFQACFGLGQSRVSYHMKKLKDAGLVREERRGRWSLYSLDGEAAESLLSGAAGWFLGKGSPVRRGSGRHESSRQARNPRGPAGDLSEALELAREHGVERTR